MFGSRKHCKLQCAVASPIQPGPWHMRVSVVITAVVLVSVACGSRGGAQHAAFVQVGAHRAGAALVVGGAPERLTRVAVAAPRPGTVRPLYGAMIGAALGGIAGGFMFSRKCQHACKLVVGFGVGIGAMVGSVLGLIAADRPDQRARSALQFSD